MIPNYKFAKNVECHISFVYLFFDKFWRRASIFSLIYGLISLWEWVKKEETFLGKNPPFLWKLVLNSMFLRKLRYLGIQFNIYSQFFLNKITFLSFHFQGSQIDLTSIPMNGLGSPVISEPHFKLNSWPISISSLNLKSKCSLISKNWRYSKKQC